MAPANDQANDHWWSNPQLWIESFVTLNLGFLTFDIYLAHSVNQFRNPAEYLPLLFSAIAAAMMLTALALRRRWVSVWKDLGYFVGWVSVLIGLTGVIYHLQSRFFYERTLQSLTYSAPFAAPLAYTGLGFLLIMNRMVNAGSVEWGQWLLLFALGGYIGNFVFSLSDHAENGFFYPTEWVAVAGSAIAIGFLVVPFATQISLQFIHFCGVILLFEGVVGAWGFVLHAIGNLYGPSIHPFANFIYGAPPMAPLLFPNLAVLGLIGFWHLRCRMIAREMSIARKPSTSTGLPKS